MASGVFKLPTVENTEAASAGLGMFAAYSAVPRATDSTTGFLSTALSFMVPLSPVIMTRPTVYCSSPIMTIMAEIRKAASPPSTLCTRGMPIKPALEKAAPKQETPSLGKISTAAATESAISSADATADCTSTAVFSAVLSAHRLLIKMTGMTAKVSSLPMSAVPCSPSSPLRKSTKPAAISKNISAIFCSNIIVVCTEIPPGFLRGFAPLV